MTPSGGLTHSGGNYACPEIIKKNHLVKRMFSLGFLVDSDSHCLNFYLLCNFLNINIILSRRV